LALEEPSRLSRGERRSRGDIDRHHYVAVAVVTGLDASWIPVRGASAVARADGEPCHRQRQARRDRSRPGVDCTNDPAPARESKRGLAGETRRHRCSRKPGGRS
jgi:hypothetical protein